MENIQRWLKYLFTTTKGLILVNTAIISIIVAVFGTLSGPLKEWGVGDITVKALGMKLLPEERSDRIIILYHTIAVSFVALLTYIITHIVSMRENQKKSIRTVVTFGYLFTVIFGLGFAYWGKSWIFHGVFLLGLSLAFYAGVLLAIALWPWNKEYYQTNTEYAHTKKGLPLERVAFFVMVLTTLGSAAFGAAAGATFGNGFYLFLAEDGVRHVHHSPLELAVIGHLHIMLTLICVAVALIVGRWFDWKGKLHIGGMICFIFGTIVITAGAWSVVWFRGIAHKIIYVGSVLVMLGALQLVIFGWAKLIREGIAGKDKPSFWQKIKALLSDPLRFGSLWQMVFMNFTVSGVGIFMAIKLDEIFRVIPFREERITLSGHWHILATLSGTIILFYIMSEIFSVKGKLRQFFGWAIIIGSDLAFAMMTLFSLKRLWVTEEAQQPVVNALMIFSEIGLGTVLTLLGVYMFILLIKLLRNKIEGLSDIK